PDPSAYEHATPSSRPRRTSIGNRRTNCDGLSCCKRGCEERDPIFLERPKVEQFHRLCSKAESVNSFTIQISQQRFFKAYARQQWQKGMICELREENRDLFHLG